MAGLIMFMAVFWIVSSLTEAESEAEGHYTLSESKNLIKYLVIWFQNLLGLWITSLRQLKFEISVTIVVAPKTGKNFPSKLPTLDVIFLYLPQITADGIDFPRMKLSKLLGFWRVSLYSLIQSRISTKVDRHFSEISRPYYAKYDNYRRFVFCVQLPVKVIRIKF